MAPEEMRRRSALLGNHLTHVLVEALASYRKEVGESADRQQLAAVLVRYGLETALSDPECSLHEVLMAIFATLEDLRPGEFDKLIGTSLDFVRDYVKKEGRA